MRIYDGCNRSNQPFRCGFLSTAQGKVLDKTMNQGKGSRRTCWTRSRSWSLPCTQRQEHCHVALENTPRTKQRYGFPDSRFLMESSVDSGDNQFSERPPLLRLLLSNHIHHTSFEWTRYTFHSIMTKKSVPDRHELITEVIFVVNRKWLILTLLGRVLCFVVLALAFSSERRCIKLGSLRCLCLSSRLFLSPKHFTELENNAADQLGPRAYLGHRKTIRSLVAFLEWLSPPLWRHCSQH